MTDKPTITVPQKFGDEFLDEIIDWIGSNVDPEDVFDVDDLEKWADDNGFIRLE